MILSVDIETLVQNRHNIMMETMALYLFQHNYPDRKVHGANMGPTWVLSAPDGPHVIPMNLAIMVVNNYNGIKGFHSYITASINCSECCKMNSLIYNLNLQSDD